jgi:hypothetical protein
MIVPQDLYGVIGCPDIVDVPKPIAGHQAERLFMMMVADRHRETCTNGAKIFDDGGVR